jgi:hypothetical protein
MQSLMGMAGVEGRKEPNFAEVWRASRQINTLAGRLHGMEFRRYARDPGQIATDQKLKGPLTSQSLQVCKSCLQACCG